LKSIFFTPTIYDESDSIASENMKGVNAALGECRDFVCNLGKEYNATVVDFWKPMAELNTRMQQTNPSFTLIGKDRIHPHATGHLVMAYLFLTQTNAPKEVWNLVMDAKNRQTVFQRNCNVSSLIIKPNRLTFKNKEFALPFPSIEAAKEAFRLVPFIDSLNQQVLQIRSCDSGHYRLKINNMEVGTYSGADFEKGINLAINTKTPQNALSDSIAKLCEEHFSKGSTLRTLRRVEIKQLSKLNIDDKVAVTAYLNKFIDEMRLQKNNPEANSGYYIMTAQTYLKDKPNEEAFKKRISEIEGLIYSLNKPQTYTYVIEKIRN
ncbi:MAG: hypothetical protein NTY32_02965, partial [Bacteroidia bacterium]|nr:hypothetical protein [Bacteroidia bacterium]